MRSIVLSAALALLAGCGSTPAHPPAELTEIQPTATLKILWQGSVGSAEKNSFFPQAFGSVVYAAGADGSVTGFDKASGRPTVSIDAGERVSGGVGVGGGLVLLGTPKGRVLAFEREGKPLWQAQLSGEVLAPPEAQEGIVVARTGDGRIHGLDAATGKRRWMYQRATPALYGAHLCRAWWCVQGGVFAGFPGGRLVALALANGNIGWEAVVALPRGTTELERVADVTSLPVIDGQQVCAAAFQGRVACFDAFRGTLLWARDVSSVAGIADGRALPLRHRRQGRRAGAGQDERRQHLAPGQTRRPQRERAACARAARRGRGPRGLRAPALARRRLVRGAHRHRRQRDQRAADRA